MDARIHTLLVSLVMTLVTAHLGAQEGTDSSDELDALLLQRLQPMLDSADPAVAAEGASLVGRYGLVAGEPQLEALLLRELPEDELRLAHRAALDAYIRLGLTCPAYLLAETCELPPLRAHSLVLMVREPAANAESLLYLLEAPLDMGSWLAVRTTLVRQRPPGLAARLLDGLHVELSLVVNDLGAASSGSASFTVRTGLSVGRGAATGANATTSLYEIVTAPRPGDVLMVSGRQPIHYRRSERPVRSLIDQEPASARLLDGARLEGLAELLGTAGRRQELTARPTFSTSYAGPDTFVAWARERREAVESAYDELLQDLLDAGLLEHRDLGALRLDLEVLVRDRRRVPEPPLPEVR